MHVCVIWKSLSELLWLNFGDLRRLTQLVCRCNYCFRRIYSFFLSFFGAICMPVFLLCCCRGMQQPCALCHRRSLTKGGGPGPFYFICLGMTMNKFITDIDTPCLYSHSPPEKCKTTKILPTIMGREFFFKKIYLLGKLDVSLSGGFGRLEAIRLT